MSNHLQNFFASNTKSAVAQLVEAYLRLPEDKRDWKPEGKSRSAHDQIAEIALLNGYTANTIEARSWVMGDPNNYLREHGEAVEQEWETIHALLLQATDRVIAAIQAVPDDALNTEFQSPWGTMTVADTVAYPYWNMTYHQGQINYIASMLGCLP